MTGWAFCLRTELIQQNPIVQTPTEGSETLLERLLGEGVAVIQSLRYATSPLGRPEDKSKVLSLWSHRAHPFYDVKNNKSPYLDRAQINVAIEEYLALPYRARQIDRLFVDIFLAVELYGFSDEMVNEYVIEGLLPSSPLKRSHPFILYLKNFAIGIGSLIVCIGATYFFHQSQLLSLDLAFGIGAITSIIFLLWFAVVSFSLPFAWREHSKRVSSVFLLMREMEGCYSELSSNGPVSATRLLERLKAAGEKGVRWPSPLYVILDDVMRRNEHL